MIFIITIISCKNIYYIKMIIWINNKGSADKVVPRFILLYSDMIICKRLRQWMIIE